jgi:hypothetical protein
MNSRINAETRNHLEWLIKIYIQMLAGSQFSFPSGYASEQQSVVNCSITVDLRNGGEEGRDKVFRDIMGDDPIKASKQIEDWKAKGIEYVKSTDEPEKYKLRVPVHNMNNVLFAYLFRVSNFGNSNIGLDGNDCTIQIYTGHVNYDQTFPLEIHVDGSNFLAGIATSKGQAEAQKKQGHQYMRVAMVGSRNEHAEHIDIDALLTLDPNNMETDKAYPIGDRNWATQIMSQDIPPLAVRKVYDTPTVKFSTLEGLRFEETDISRICVFNTEIKRFAPEFSL